MSTITEALSKAIIQLTEAGVDNPRLDAEVLLAFVLERKRGWLWTYPEHELSARQVQVYHELIARRVNREPLAYLLGEWEFYGLPFYTVPGVLIPRPETELLVEAVIDWARTHACNQIVDVGTGSGAIAVTLALQLPQTIVTAIDLSPDALQIAQRNVERHGVSQRICLITGDLLLPLMEEGKNDIDAVVANLPYIPKADIPSLMPEVRDFEPRLALEADEEGLALIYRLIEQSQSVLRPGGLLALEVGIHQASSVASCLEERGWRMIRIIKDYAGIPRHVLAEFGAIHE